MYACAGKREIVTEQKQVLPAVEDVVMYEINPRDNPLKNTFKVKSKQLDSYQNSKVNVVLLMPIFDWVANHTSWDHAWIKEHKEWYTQDSIGNIISPAGTGWNDVADLNYDNADMCLAMIDAMKYWIQEVGVDGFRCDAAENIP